MGDPFNLVPVLFSRMPFGTFGPDLTLFFTTHLLFLLRKCGFVRYCCFPLFLFLQGFFSTSKSSSPLFPDQVQVTLEWGLKCLSFPPLSFQTFYLIDLDPPLGMTSAICFNSRRISLLFTSTTYASSQESEDLIFSHALRTGVQFLFKDG